jgi:hypothetical protein
MTMSSKCGVRTLACRVETFQETAHNATRRVRVSFSQGGRRRILCAFLDTVFLAEEPGRRQEWRRGAHECVRHTEMAQLFPEGYLEQVEGVAYDIHSS